MSDLTFDYVTSILKYDPQTGYLIWKKRPIDHFPDARAFKIWNTRWANKPAGNKTKHKGIQIRINKKNYIAHRIVWLLAYESYPIDDIDHIDNNPNNNRLSNLRLASKSENQWNTRKHKNNTSGFKGVYFDRRSNRWVSKIMINNKNVYLGSFKSADDAHNAYKKASLSMHGRFSNFTQEASLA